MNSIRKMTRCYNLIIKTLKIDNRTVSTVLVCFLKKHENILIAKMSVMSADIKSRYSNNTERNRRQHFHVFTYDRSTKS